MGKLRHGGSWGRTPVCRLDAGAGWDGCGPTLTLPSLPRLGDLGLEQFSVSELFSSTLIPGFFLLACILQLHYFHRPFMHITGLEHIPAATPPACHIPR